MPDGEAADAAKVVLVAKLALEVLTRPRGRVSAAADVVQRKPVEAAAPPSSRADREAHARHVGGGRAAGDGGERLLHAHHGVGVDLIGGRARTN